MILKTIRVIHDLDDWGMVYVQKVKPSLVVLVALGLLGLVQDLRGLLFFSSLALIQEVVQSEHLELAAFPAASIALYKRGGQILVVRPLFLVLVYVRIQLEHLKVLGAENLSMGIYLEAWLKEVRPEFLFLRRVYFLHNNAWLR
mgnify:CR=1 FL=1